MTIVTGIGEGLAARHMESLGESASLLPPSAIVRNGRAGSRGVVAKGAVPAIISVKNLTKTYASGLEALKDVDLEIRRGEIFALLGPNGAGKTTLIGVICGLVKPTRGTVLADGHDIV